MTTVMQVACLPAPAAALVLALVLVLGLGAAAGTKAPVAASLATNAMGTDSPARRQLVDSFISPGAMAADAAPAPAAGSDPRRKLVDAFISPGAMAADAAPAPAPRSEPRRQLADAFISPGAMAADAAPAPAAPAMSAGSAPLPRRELIKYISYDSLKQDSIPCNKRVGTDANCLPAKSGNRYRCGCSAISGCARNTN